MIRGRRCLVGVAAVLVMGGCASSTRSASSSATRDVATTASAVLTSVPTTSRPPPTTALPPTPTTTAATTTALPTMTTAATTTTTEAVTTTTEPVDSGTVDIGGYLVEPSALDVRYVVLNNTNHGIVNPRVHIDYLDGAGQTLVSSDDIADARLAPGDFAVDRAIVPSAPGVHDMQAALTDVRITVLDSAEAKIALSPVTVEGLRAVPAAAVGGGGTVALGMLVNTSDVDQDIAEIHALALNGFGRADPLDLTDPTWLTRIKPGERLPFALHTSMVGVAADSFRVSISSAPSDAANAVQFSVGPLSMFLGPDSEGEGSDDDNLQVVGELTNTGSTGFASPQHTGMCLLRDSSGAIVDVSPTLSFSNRGAGELRIELATDIEPNTASPFSCGEFDAAMATSLPADPGSYTVEALFTPDAFSPASPPSDVSLTPSTASASFQGNEIAVTVTFTNPLPDPHAAGAVVRVYDDATGALLSFAEQTFIEVVAGNGRYDVGPGETKSMVVGVNVPPGTTADAVRIESSVELTPAGTVG